MNRSEIKKFIPPIVLDKFAHLMPVPKLSNKKFTKWWDKFKISQSLPHDLILMVDFYINTSLFTETSDYWNFLSKRHIELLTQYKIDNFKQTVEKLSYSGELNTDSKLIKPLLDNDINVDVKTEEVFRYHDFCSKRDSIEHNLSNIMVLNYLVSNGYEKYLEILEESSFGNPIFIKYNNRKVSFALLNSILEIDILYKNFKLDSKTRFLEIGGGSGRTALSLFGLLPDSKYIIVDIPPALYISQENIIKNLPHKRIFKFQDIENAGVKDEFDKCDIAFLSPEQIGFIPDKSVDVAIAIDCLHEMTTTNVEKYFKHFDRIANNFYFKCQIVQWAKTSDVLYTIDSYPVRENWKKLIHERCYIPNEYFQAIYKI